MNLVMLLASVAGSAADVQRDAETKTVQGIQGLWRIESISQGDMAVFTDMPGWCLRIKAEQMQILGPNRKPTIDGLKYTLLAGQSPSVIVTEQSPANPKWGHQYTHAIYRLDGRKLVLCFSKERPVGFIVPEDCQTWVLSRVPK